MTLIAYLLAIAIAGLLMRRTPPEPITDREAGELLARRYDGHRLYYAHVRGQWHVWVGGTVEETDDAIWHDASRGLLTFHEAAKLRERLLEGCCRGR